MVAAAAEGVPGEAAAAGRAGLRPRLVFAVVRAGKSASTEKGSGTGTARGRVESQGPAAPVVPVALAVPAVPAAEAGN
jgi:hypothetical protein